VAITIRNSDNSGLFPLTETLKVCGLLVLAVLLILLPADFFDGSTTICLSRVLFDIECYACGMTRACMRIIHLEFREAMDFNLLAFAVMPLLGFIWLKELKNSSAALIRHFQKNS
jgi:hypothetical protein